MVNYPQLLTGNIQKESLKKSHVLIYPNPASTFITVNYEGQNKAELFYYKIYSALGTLLKSGKSGSIIDISDLNKGFYTMEIIGKSGSFTEKIIKE